MKMNWHFVKHNVKQIILDVDVVVDIVVVLVKPALAEQSCFKG